MAKQSVMIAGFAYSGLSVGRDNATNLQWSDFIIHFGYLSTTTIAMVCGMTVILVGTLCSIFGPGLALRGADGSKSMHRAVDVMKGESVFCFNIFSAMLFFFHLSSFMLMWVLYDKAVAICVNIVLIFFFVMFIRNGIEITSRLHVREDEAVDGKFADFSQSYQQM